MARSLSQSGNVLFLILIAVALFAALSFAVTNTSRSGSGDTSKEKSELDMNVINNYVSDLRTAVLRLRASGCSDEQLNTTAPGWNSPWPYTNQVAPGNQSCDIYSAKGGGVIWQKPPAMSQANGGSEYTISASMGVEGIGLNGKNDMILFARLPKQACLDTNTKLGITNPSGNPPSAALGNGLGPQAPSYMSFGNNSHNSAGIYEVYAGDIAFGSNWTGLNGKNEGCFFDTNISVYYYYAV